MNIKTKSVALVLVPLLALAPALRAADPAAPAKSKPAHAEAALKVEDLPAAVRDAAKAAAHGAAIDHVEKKTTKDGAVHYLIHFGGKEAGKGHKLVLDANGHEVTVQKKK